MKIGIVGSGMVGATAAYAILMRGVGREIVLVDRAEARAEAETYDLRHAVPFSHPLTVDYGRYNRLKGCKIVVISAGVAQKVGETRLDLLKRNAAVFADVVPKVLEQAPESILVIATNPVDVMTAVAEHYAAKFGVPGDRVLGTGTMLDTARFRSLVGERVGVDPHHVHGYVVGEHGDSEVLAWSQLNIGGMPLEDFCRHRGPNFDERLREQIDHEVRNAAYKIIGGKGATYYGIGAAIAKLADVILHDQRSVLTVTSPADEFDGACVALPRLVGGDGIIGTLPLPLGEQEQQDLEKSAQIVGGATAELMAALD